MKVNRVLSIAYSLVALIGLGLGGLQVRAQSAMVQTPIVSLEWGLPGTTYSGGTAQTSTCTSSTPGYISAGNGCPATEVNAEQVYGLSMDSSGDLAIALQVGRGVNILYEGGSSAAAMITGAYPGQSITPTVGYSYALTDGSTATLTAQSGVYYCNNTTADGVALDQYGDGCPGEYVDDQTKAVTFDPDGNIFFTGQSQTIIHVIYAGGVRAANLIDAYNPSVAASGGPRPGYVYALSSPNDFVTAQNIAVQAVSATQENLFVADSGNSAVSETGLDATTSGKQVKEFVCPGGTTGCNTSVNGNSYTSAGWATYLAAASGTSANGDGGPVASASIYGALEIMSDQWGDLYVEAPAEKRIRVIYNGGETPPLYASNTVVASPQIGDIYTVAGGGSSTTLTAPAAANTLSLVADNGTPGPFGVDANGNLYIVTVSTSATTGAELIEVNAQTGLAYAIGFTGASSTTFTENTDPSAGAYCNGGSTGPTMTDAYGDGCPATEATTVAKPTIIPFDAQGNFYLNDTRSSSASTAVVHKYSFSNQFGTVAQGTPETQVLAFTPSTAGGSVTYSPSVPPTVSPATDYTDSGANDACTTVNSTQTCIFNVTLQPSKAGARPGSLSVVQGSTTLSTVLLGGVGQGAQIALDPATPTAIGSGLQPSGIAVDQSGNVYISSGTSTGVVYKSSNGAAPVLFATGLANPAQVAVDGEGHVYVADSGNNRVAIVGPAGGAVSGFLSGTFSVTNTSTTPATVLSNQSLSSPQGVAVDLSGNVYIADTGNNRVLKVLADNNGLSTQVYLLNISGLNQPEGLAVDAADDLFVANSGARQVVELSAAGVQSVVSSSYSPSLATPVGVAVDAAGDLYVADAGNEDVVVVDAGSNAAQPLLTGTSGIAGVAVSNDGNVYMADSGATSLSVLQRTAGDYAISGDIAVGSSSPQQTLTLTNTGNSSLSFGSPLTQGTDSADFLISSSSTEGCSASNTTSAGGQCMLAAIFQPQAINGSLDSDTVSFPTSNAINGATVTLTGTAQQLGLTYSIVGAGTLTGTVNVAFTATLSLSSSSPLNGSVSFVIDNSTTLSGNIANGIASVTAALTTGSHTVTATYNSGFSNTLTFNVVAGISSVKLTYLPAAPTFGQQVVVTAAVATGNSTQTPTGTITFTVNGISQAPVAYAPSSTLTLSSLPVGVTQVEVAYSGDSNYGPATSQTSITVAQAPTSTTEQVTPNVSSSGNTITLSASITPVYATPPTGQVTFSSGGNVLGTGTVVNGQASFTTTTSQLSSYAFTATYSGDSNYVGSSSTVSPSPTYVMSLSSSSLTVIQNSVNSITATLNPFFGYTGTIQITCSNLPTYTTCGPSPGGALSVTATANQSAQVQIITDAQPPAVNAAGLSTTVRGNKLLTAGSFALVLILLLPLWKQRRALRGLLAFCLLAVSVYAISGCASSTYSDVFDQTPTGTYSVVITATDGTITNSSNLALTVLAGSPAARPTVVLNSNR